LSATIRDVARASGLSTATVSRVLNEDAAVSEATATKVRAELSRLGYTMNRVARSLKTRSTRTVGVIAPRLASDFFMLLAESMDRELSAHGYSLIVCSSWESAEEEAKRMRLFAERLVDGIVVIPATGSGERLARERLRLAKASGTPGHRGRRRPRRQRGRRLRRDPRPPVGGPRLSPEQDGLHRR
jgi:LacI family transcriptional regulator